MTPERAPQDEEGKVGRWSEHAVWECDGRATGDGAPCWWRHAVRIAKCENCHTIRPPLPETPAPTPEPSVLADICREHGDAEEARLYGKEPIEGVDDERSEDELCEDCGTRKAAVHLESASVNELCEPCYIALLERLLKRERERPESSVDAVVKVLRGEFGHLPSVDADVLDYSARRVLAALRAVPVEGDATARYRKRGLTPEMVEAHYPTRQHQFDECKTCRAIHDIAKEALATPTPSEDRPLYAHPALDARDA